LKRLNQWEGGVAPKRHSGVSGDRKTIVRVKMGGSRKGLKSKRGGESRKCYVGLQGQFKSERPAGKGGGKSIRKAIFKEGEV